LNACSESTSKTIVKLCYPMDGDILLIVNELNRHSIQHEFNKEERCIYGNETLRENKKEIELSAFGVFPSEGLSTTYRDNNQPFINLLNENGIETEIHRYKDMEYISWLYKDHEKAEELLEFEPWLKVLMSEARIDAKQEPNKKL